VPKPVAAFGAKAADDAHLEWLKATAAPLSDKAQVVLEPGVADASFRPLWAEVILPVEAPPLDEFAGRVLTSDGTVNSTFQIAAKPVAAGAFKLYHLTFPLSPGSYRLELAGASGGQVKLVQAAEIELAPIPGEGAWMSPLWVGLDAQREEGVPLGSAYTFGGWHLTPLVDPAVTKHDELSYFGFIAHPGTTEGGSTAVTAQVTVKRGDKRLGQPFVTPLRTVELVPGLHLYANSIALGGLPELGEYTLDFAIVDSITSVSTNRSVNLELVASEGAVTYESFLRIADGATLRDVRILLGGEGTLQGASTTGPPVIESWTWNQPSGAGTISVTFTDGKVSSKAQAGLKQD
jgi:hypothetical protein